MRPIAEYEPMDRERFEREIVPKGEPAVFRGLVADWPAVRAAEDGPEALAGMIKFAATDDPVSVRVGGKEKFGAIPVISRGQVSVEVQARKFGRQR